MGRRASPPPLRTIRVEGGSFTKIIFLCWNLNIVHNTTITKAWMLYHQHKVQTYGLNMLKSTNEPPNMPNTNRTRQESWTEKVFAIGGTCWCESESISSQFQWSHKCCKTGRWTQTHRPPPARLLHRRKWRHVRRPELLGPKFCLGPPPPAAFVFRACSAPFCFAVASAPRREKQLLFWIGAAAILNRIKSTVVFIRAWKCWVFL